MEEKQKVKNARGITLVSLVVTIIVLIILAGVSISLILGENGIITKTKYAKQVTLNAQVEEQEKLNELASYLENIGGIETNPSEIKTVEELKGKDYFDEKTTVKDSNGNLIEIPEGFKIAEDSGINVTEGIVIEDNDIIEGIGNNRGNQYVWIPVGEGIKKSDGTEVDITLGRYVFADGMNHKAEDGTTVLEKGTPILKQSAENYESETEIHIKDIQPTSTENYGYKELKTNRDGVANDGADGENATALNLKGFIDSVKANGGYYIARYEASYGEDEKVNSKVSNSPNDTSVAPTAEGTLWNNITQLDAVVASRGLYTTATTDLINSYAWDTAIVYIQEFSGDKDYSYQLGKNINSSLSNTGVNEDEVCKINDMASNTYELTTEYSSYTYYSADFHTNFVFPCTARGGIYNLSLDYAWYRNSNGVAASFKDFTFRSTLYM